MIVYFALFLIGYLAGHFPSQRHPFFWTRGQSIVRGLRSWGLLLLAHGWLGGTLAPALTGLAVLLGERYPIYDFFISRKVPRPLNLYSLAGIWLALDWQVGLLWLFFLYIWRLWPPLSLHPYIVQLLLAALPIGMGYVLHKPDSFLILSILVGTQLVIGPFLQWLMSQGWLPQKSRKRSFAAGVPIGLFAVSFVLLIYYLNYFVYYGFGDDINVFRRGTPEVKAVVLTFDDGPNLQYTPRILDILDRYQVPATFFMVGKEVEQYPELARTIVRKGYEIGNHTYSHRNLYGQRQELIYQEIERANRVIESVTGERPLFFRPPRGVYTEPVLDVTRENRQLVVLFSLSGMDWAELPPRMIANRVLSQVRPGDILLLHDSGDLITNEGGDRNNTVEALPLIIEGLEQQGYRFLTLSQMLVLSGMEGYLDQATRPSNHERGYVER